jgi:replicative DNA helicase
MVDTVPSNVTPLRGNEVNYRAPPQNTEAEQALLGAILVNNEAYRRVAEFLLPEHFGAPVHGRIYAAARTLIERAQIANPVTLKNQFDQDGALAEVGGAQYLARLAASMVTIINAADYGRTIYDLHLRRQLIAIGEDTVNDAYAYDLEREGMAQIEAAEKKLFDLATTGLNERGFQDFQTAYTKAIDMAQAAFQKSGRTVGVATGFTDLDKKLGGLHPSDLIILAGRPSMGKTALATNIAFNAARAYREGTAPDGKRVAEDGGVVGFFSLEMSAEQLATRVLSERSGVSSDKIRRGEISHHDFEKFLAASQDLAEIPLHIDDTPALTIGALRTRARRLQRSKGLDLVVVDYLQLLRGSGEGYGPDNRVQEVSEVTRGLKALAKELNLPVLALSQLSRQVESREDKRPMLSDLRESGSIEQDADVVMFIYRDEYYNGERATPKKLPEEDEAKFQKRYDTWFAHFQEIHDQADVIVAKQRHGPIGTIKLRFDTNTTKFDNLAEDDRLPEARF